MLVSVPTLSPHSSGVFPQFQHLLFRSSSIPSCGHLLLSIWGGGILALSEINERTGRESIPERAGPVEPEPFGDGAEKLPVRLMTHRVLAIVAVWSWLEQPQIQAVFACRL